MLVPSLLGLWLASTGPALTVQVEGVRSAQGAIFCTLHDQPAAFPGDATKAVARAQSPAQVGKVVLHLEGVPPGDYALSCFHDENGNGQLDFNFLHIPKEGVAVSNDPKARMGPPTFADARFHYSGGEQGMTVHLVY